MKTWKAALGVLGIFILGTVFGLVISFWIAPRAARSMSPVQEILTQRLNQRLSANLSLSPEQKQAIAAITEDARNQLVAIRKETQPRVRQIIQDARNKIRAQLNPDQQARFDQLVRRNRMQFNRFLTR
jgi:Spy/CpxP family protein refolding chaperone